MSSRERGVIIAGNWKLNHTIQETKSFFQSISESWEALSENTLKGLENHSLEAVIFPPYLSLFVAMNSREGHPIQVGAQNAHWEKSGAFTGEVSGPMLKELGLQWCLVGHSERRQYFGETNETAGKRAKSLLEQGFRVIFCLGESKEQREAGKTKDVLKEQLSGGLGHLPKEYLDGRLVIAYEPVWAIGTGLTATPDQAEEAHAFIRSWLEEKHGTQPAETTRILYGGSVKPENIDELLRCPNVDGGLVGGASLKAQAFLELLNAGGKAIS